MEIFELGGNTTGRNPLDADLPDLIDAIGTMDFEARVFHAIRRATDSIHVTAFAKHGDEATRLVLAADLDDGELARRVGRTYAARFWAADPVNGLLGARPGVRTLMTRARGDEIRKAGFRRHCYDGADWSAVGMQMAERLSLMSARNGALLKISFHRAEQTGYFTQDEIDWMVDAADLLFALVGRHERLAPARQQPAGRAFYADRVLQTAPELSRREADVCARIAMGLTTEGIALDLGISLNTVRTYRKRAYQRLGISSHNELLKLMLWTPDAVHAGH